MTTIPGRALRGALAACTFAFAGPAVVAQDSPAPVRLDPDKIAGLNLTAIPPDAYQEILPLRTRHIDGTAMIVPGVPADYDPKATAAMYRQALSR